MPPVPIKQVADSIDFAPRFATSSTVAASPAAASETTICTLTVAQNITANGGVFLQGCFSITIGTSGVSCTIKIRRTDTSGQTIYTTGANTVTAGNLYTFGIQGVDTGPTLPGQVYVLTVTIGSGAATSTVSAASLTAEVW